jgi:hypothetical protein
VRSIEKIEITEIGTGDPSFRPANFAGPMVNERLGALLPLIRRLP